MSDLDMVPVSRRKSLSWLLPWARDHSRRATAIGVGLLLLCSAVIALPPPAIVLGILIGLPSVLILTAVVSARAPVGMRWLAVIALFAAIWCVTTLGVGIDKTVLQAAGHVESCRYLNQTTSEDKYGGIKYTDIVGCPDGTHSFGDSTGVPPVSHGMIPVRTVANGLFGVSPGWQSNWGLTFFALPGPFVLAGLLIGVLRTPRSRRVTVMSSR
jgi:hypothetical protein